MGFLGVIANWFLGGGLSAIGKIAVDLYSKKVDATNNADKLLADLTAREMEVNAKLVIAEQGNWMTRWVRPAWTAPFVLWTWKAVVWDKLIMAGTSATAPLDGTLGWLCVTIATAYFGGRTVEKVTQIIAGNRR